MREGEGASTAMGEGGDGAAEILGECERRGRTRDDGGSERVIEGNGGKEMDGGGRGGRRQKVRLPLKDPVSRRVPLRGRRRGAKAVKEQDERRMAQHMLKWLDTNQRRDT